jgi:cytochrome c oxidase subunit 2
MHIDRYERYWIIIVAAVLGAFFAALLAGMLIFGVRLPSSPGAENFVNPLALDQQFGAPGLRDMGDNHYTAHIIAQMWSFDVGSDETYKDYFESQNPNIPYNGPDAGNQVIRVPQGATVNFEITSRDVTHGFLVERHNGNIEVVPGHIGRTTVKFRESGEFRILCHEYCGRAHQQMHVIVVVEPGEEA